MSTGQLMCEAYSHSVTVGQLMST
uniref:Uncharacterized protein n=1 Tax=Rhizophora mucronata TaxID=61149 RepID=A0A2P2JKC6_RHIMU